MDKAKVELKLQFKKKWTQWLGLSIFDPKLGWRVLQLLW